MALITNQATITYQSNGICQTAISNIASTTLEGPLCVSKTALGCEYALGEAITYILTTTNKGTTTLYDIKIKDDLGAKECCHAPLDYTGPAQLYLNGVICPNLCVDECEDGITFTIPTLGPGVIAMIIYRATPNQYAPLERCSTITNTSVWQTPCNCTSDPTDCTTLTVEEHALVTLTKVMCPDPISCGDTIRYTFNLTNTGNIPAKDVVLTDTFEPAPCNITVTVDGVVLDCKDYTYDDGTLTIHRCINVPEATYTTHDCVVTTTPGTTTIVVTGIL